jgi:hypothetical protein
LWDLGGQKRHIDEYLEEPEKFFVQVDVLIYVIDSQDDVRYYDELKYLNDLTNILDYLNEFPYVLVLLNKCDADFRNDPDFQIKREYIKDKIINFFENQQKQWNIEIIPTSIYNYYSNKPEIAESIKEIFSIDSDKKMSKLIPQIETKVQKLLDFNLKFMENIMSEINEMKRLLIRISPMKITKSIFDIPFQQNYFEEGSDKINKVKHFQNTTPKPLDFENRPPTEKPKKMIDEIKEIELEKVSNKEFPTKPPSAPRKIESKINLNPPKDPSIYSSSDISTNNIIENNKVENQKFNRGSIRKELISELKDLFIKRGITE